MYTYGTENELQNIKEIMVPSMPQNNYGKQLTCLESRECQQHIVSNSETTVPLEVVN